MSAHHSNAWLTVRVRELESENARQGEALTRVVETIGQRAKNCAVEGSSCEGAIRRSELFAMAEGYRRAGLLLRREMEAEVKRLESTIRTGIAVARRTAADERAAKAEQQRESLADSLIEAVSILRALRSGTQPPVALLDCIDSSVAAIRAAGRQPAP